MGMDLSDGNGHKRDCALPPGVSLRGEEGGISPHYHKHGPWPLS